MGKQKVPKLYKIQRTVVSYCAMPEEVTKDSHLSELPCDVYYEYSVTRKSEQMSFDDDFSVDNWIIDNYPELEGQTILIHIDY